MNIPKKRALSCQLAVLALAVAAATTGQAATTTYPSRIDLRPLTPSDKTDYGLSSAQAASGMSTIGVGQPAYLEAQVTLSLPATNILSVSWTLTSQPIGSAAVLLPSPFGTNVPIYRPADALVYRVASRTMLRPDVRGQYTVSATITTTSGTTNVVQNITAGTYMGVSTCELCHSGGLIAPDMYHSWSNTLHATKFTRSINGQVGSYSKNCISCHTAGYDANTNAINGGFDDVATQVGWAFPTNLASTNFASMPASLQNVANIQCENCHGPGSEHAYSLGDTSRISANLGPANCAQCHDAKTHHIKTPEWKNSRHAVATRTPSGAGRDNCVRCHTTAGFINYVQGDTKTNTVYEAIGCAACHDPHDATNPHQLRKSTQITLGDGTTVTNAGLGGFCMNCHQSRTGNATNSIVNYPLLLPTWKGGSSFGPHDSPVADMLEGVNGITYGQEIPSSAHRYAIEDTCVHCHMQPTPAATDPAFLQAGGHTMKMSYVATNGTTVHMVGACTECHGPVSSFDLARDDYNGDGVIEGVQTEVQHLLDKLSTLMPNSTYRADGNYVADGLVKSSPSVKTNWPAKFLKAGWNFQFVKNDASFGVHNAPYAVGLLKASIGDLTGDANNDGLADWWQNQYFGSTTSANAAPNYCAAGDGIPNWLKYSLGLNPMVAGMNVQGGVVWANGTTLGNSSATNTVQIYTAAEVAFNTEVGKNYQIQAISSLGGGWQNIGTPIAGTGAAISYVTPTRQNVQQFYRVAQVP